MNKSKKQRILKIFATGFLIVLVILFFCGILFNLYSFFNMTDSGLKVAFTVFGLAFLVDMVVIRTIAVISIAIVKTLST